MSVINDTNLYTAWGKLGKALNGVNTFRGTTVPGYSTSIPLLTDMQAYPTVASEIIDAFTALAGSSQIKAAQSAIQTAAGDLAISVANTYTGNSADSSVADALNTIFGYFYTADNSSASGHIARNTLSVSNVAYTNVGNGAIVSTLQNVFGQNLQMCLAEVLNVVCSSDSVSGRATAGQETFNVAGQTKQKDTLAASFPQGSGASVNINSADPTVYAATANLTSNGGLELWSGNTPNQFTIIAGTAGVEVIKESSLVYDGSASMKLVGNTGTNCIVEQLFGNGTTGTAATLAPQTHYSFCVALRSSAVLGSGSLKFSIYDKTNGRDLVVYDPFDGTNASEATTVNCTSLTTSYALFTGVFLTPRVLPASYAFRITCASVPAGSVYVDHLGLTQMTQLYTNGPSLSIHSGSTNWVQADGWQTTVANNYGCKWATFLQQVFDLNSLGMIAPNAASPTINDSLLT